MVMVKKSTVVRSASMLFVAAAIGHFMQNGWANASLAEPELTHIATPSLASGVPLPPLVLHLPTNLPIASTDLPNRMATVASAQGPQVMDDLPQTPFQFLCTPNLRARAVPGAQIAIMLDAPCDANQPVAIMHEGLKFTMTTDSNGALSFIMPAMAPEALVTLGMANGAEYEAAAEVPEAAEFTRAVVQWQGQSGLAIHAFEFGADYNEQGHVSAVMPEDEAPYANTRGQITRLGQSDMANARTAEVYSLPLQRVKQGGQVDLIVEAEILPENCGQEVQAEALQVLPDGSRPRTELTLAVPECSAVGDYLVLNNLLEDLTIAIN